MKPLFVAVLSLALVGPAQAENFYEYGQRVLVSPPLTVEAPGHVTWTVRMPVFGLVGLPYVKGCQGRPGWDGSLPPEDEQITLYAARTNYTTGTYRLVFGDRAEGRTYQVCLRLPFLPMGEP